MKSTRHVFGLRSHGFMTLDAILAMLILSLLTGVAVVALTRHNAGLRRLAQQRQAMRQAETALTHLQTTRRLPPELTGQITCSMLSPLQDVPTYRWIQIRSRFGEARGQLVGVVPVSSLENLPSAVVKPAQDRVSEVQP